MKRVLIIGPKFHYFLESLSRAFAELGWNTNVDSYDNPVHPYTLCNKVRYKLSADKLGEKKKSCERYEGYIRSVYDLQKPDLVFIVNGDNLQSSTITFFRQNSKVIIWFFDSIARLAPYCRENAKEADAVYCYEQEDIPLLLAEGVTACFLPQGVDKQLYYPIEGVKKKYDIVFAGEIWSSKKRQEYLKALIEHFPDKRIRIVGRYKIPTKGFFEWLFREHRDIYTNQNASVEELNRLYNEARVVLNIHHEQQKNGANPKVYEIIASGVWQVCDRNPYIESHFQGCPILLYSNIDEMLKQIELALKKSDINYSNEEINRNTFVQRVAQIFQDQNLG